MAADHDPAAAERAIRAADRCDRLAACSEEPGAITRPYGSPSLREAERLVAAWMEAAGLTARRDAVGNLIGHRPGPTPAAPTLCLGSHLDSVRDAGRWDGPLGVMVAIAVAERLHAEGRALPFALDVLAFPDEEGLRFHTAYLGSRAWAGSLDPALLDRADAEGTTLAEAVAAFDGDPDVLRHGTEPPANLLGYVEAHIEQGPALERLAAPLAVVTAIAGQTRVALALAGEAGHAGTVAMPLRRDALVGAAELVVAVEALALATPGLVATVGSLAVEPGASNVVPGRVAASLDVRHPDDAVRTRARDELRRTAAAIAERRHLALDWNVVQENPATPCDPALTAALAAAVAAADLPVHALVSGAGHDAVIAAAVCPVAMLFVRCAGGVSHNPAESVAVADVAAAIRVMDGFVAMLATSQIPSEDLGHLAT